MVNHGRLAKVIILLMLSMTGGALLLLTLEGKPIKPMPFSLSSQVRLPSVELTLGTENGIDRDRWRDIEISYHSNNGYLSDEFGLSGPLAREYHFVISDGSGGHDGEIYASHRWTKQLTCEQSPGAFANPDTIRICLLGDAKTRQSTPRQIRQLEILVKSLDRNCRHKLAVNWVYR